MRIRVGYLSHIMYSREEWKKAAKERRSKGTGEKASERVAEACS